MNQTTLDNTMLLYTIILFLVIGFVFVCIRKGRDKITNKGDVNSTTVIISCFIDAIYSEFLKKADTVVHNLTLIGVSNFEDFKKKAKEAILELLKTEVDKYVKEGNKYADFFKSISYTTLTLILNEILEESLIEETIENWYDELMENVEKSAMEYEKEVTEENKSFEDGTAKVPEYKEVEEETIQEENEEVDETELEESIDE